MDRHFRLTAIPAPRLHLFAWLSWKTLFPALVGHHGTLQQFRRLTTLPDQIHAAARLRFASPAKSLSELVKRFAALKGEISLILTTRGQNNDYLGNDAPADVCGVGVVHADRLPCRVFADGGRAVFGFISIKWAFHPVFFARSHSPQRIFGSVIANELLLAIPFFTFMGAVLERSRLAEDMLDSMGQLFGRVRGGLGYSVILVSFVLGAITGTVAAQVIAMAMISLPVMMRYGYNMRYTTGVLAASGTIAQIVPPSLVLIILADQLKTPTASADVGSMYLGAWIPAAMQIGLFMLYTFS